MALMLGLAGCTFGDDESRPDASGSPTSVTKMLPSCKEVLIVGQILPTDFRGCHDGSRRDLNVQRHNCEYGGPPIFTAPGVYARAGSKITKIDADDRGPYRDAMAACTSLL